MAIFTNISNLRKDIITNIDLAAAGPVKPCEGLGFSAEIAIQRILTEIVLN